jgi:hypothetical protein
VCCQSRGRRAAIDERTGRTYTAHDQVAITAVADFYAVLDARDAAGVESKMPICPSAENYVAADSIQLAGSDNGRAAFIKLFDGSGRVGGVGGFPPGGPGGPGAR